MKFIRPVSLIVFATLCGFIVLSGCGSSAPTEAARLDSLNGSVEVRKSKVEEFSPAEHNQPLNIGGAIRTGRNSSVNVWFSEENLAAIKSEAFFEYENSIPFATQNQGLVIYRFNGPKKEIKVVTPYGVTAIVGTIFSLEVATDSSTLIVEKGIVSFKPLSGEEVQVTAGERVVADINGITSPVHSVDPLLRQNIFKDSNLENSTINR